MPEQPLPPEDERLSLRQAAELMGKSTKAVQQLVSRGSLRSARENVNPATGRAARVVTTEAWIREYLAGGSEILTARPWHLESESSLPTRKARETTAKGYWQEIAERQAVEILRLEARIAELEQRR